MSLRVVVAVFLALSIAGCGKSLSRDDAAAHILKADAMAIFTSSVPIHNPADLVSRAKKEGIRISENRLLFFAAPDRIEVGDKLLSEVESKIEFSEEQKAFFLRTKKPITLRVNVTGVTEDPGSKGIRQAEFTWTQEGLPPIVRRFSADGGRGTALFRLFDDGWRIESIDIRISETGIKLSSEELAMQAADIAAQAKMVAELRERAAAESAARSQRLSKARLQTEKLKEFVYVLDGKTYRVLITNSYLWASYEGNPEHRFSYLWFGALLGFKDEGTWGLKAQTSCSTYHNIIVVMPQDMRPQFLAALDSARSKWREAHGEFYPVAKTDAYCADAIDVGLNNGALPSVSATSFH